MISTAASLKTDQTLHPREAAKNLHVAEERLLLKYVANNLNNWARTDFSLPDDEADIGRVGRRNSSQYTQYLLGFRDNLVERGILEKIQDDYYRLTKFGREVISQLLFLRAEDLHSKNNQYLNDAAAANNLHVAEAELLLKYVANDGNNWARTDFSLPDDEADIGRVGRLTSSQYTQYLLGFRDNLVERGILEKIQEDYYRLTNFGRAVVYQLLYFRGEDNLRLNRGL